jgi:hypothetical protein
MSIRVMTSVWDDARTQAHSELLVLLALADWSNDEGHCWPTISALATKARLSERAVQQILRRLTATGRVRRIQGGGRGRANQYQVLTARNGAAGTVNTIHRKENTESEAPNEMRPLEPERVNSTTKNGERRAPHTSYIRQSNTSTTTTNGEATSVGASSSLALADELAVEYGLSSRQRDTVARYIRSRGEEYVQAKVQVVRSQPRCNAAGALLAALRDDWQTRVGQAQNYGALNQQTRLAAADARARAKGWTW